MKKLILPTCLATLFALSACSKVEDMHDATMAMSTTTTDMANTTNDLSETTKQTKNLMQEIYDSGRQGASLDLRNKLFDIVTKSNSLEEKATNSGLYFMAFEYELWSDNGSDSREGQRHRLMKDAAEEFFCHLLSILRWQGIDPFAGKNPFNKDASENEKASFNAFALTLEKSNRKQDEANEAELDSASMRNMIETALMAGKKIEDGEAKLKDFPEYVEVVLAHREIAVSLLKARYQMLGLAVITQYIPISRDAIEGMKYKIFGVNWKIEVNALNESKNNLAKFRLNEAIRAKNVLSAIGERVEIDTSVKSILSNAKVVVNAKKGISEEAVATFTEEAGEIKDLLKDYAAL